MDCIMCMMVDLRKTLADFFDFQNLLSLWVSMLLDVVLCSVYCKMCMLEVLYQLLAFRSNLAILLA